LKNYLKNLTIKKKMSCDFDLFLKLIEENLQKEPKCQQISIEPEVEIDEIIKKKIDCKVIKDLNTKHIFTNFTPTNLRVSTITVCATINLDDSIKNFVNKTILQRHCCKKCYEMFLDIENHTCDKIIKKKGSFYNQQTLLITLPNKKKVNFKIFWNGKVQITGLKSELHGVKAIEIFIEFIKKLQLRYKNTEEWVITDSKLLQMDNYRVCLINSDFSVNFKIKRNLLYELLKKKYKISVSYEPDYYQGVNSKFYWNRVNKKMTGKCNCTINCNGKGKGNGNGDCKKVTISIFQSGKIIITGAQTYHQIKDAYLFINKVLDSEYLTIKRNEIMIEKTDDILNKKIFIDKTKIINFHLYNKLLFI